jgi:hypothetical protein
LRVGWLQCICSCLPPCNDDVADIDFFNHCVLASVPFSLTGTSTAITILKMVS